MTRSPRTSTNTPGWLLEGELAMCPCGCIGRRKKGSFIEKTLAGSAGVLRQAIFSDDLTARPGLLQRIDPRVKMVAMVVLLLTASSVHHIAALVLMYLLTLAAAASSRLPLSFFVKRVWLFVPIFTLVVVLPATLSIITPGNVVLHLWTWQGQPEGLTQQGLTSAALVVSRVAVSISVVALLTLTTPWTRLLAALRTLGVPRIFILVIGMAYRYIFLLLGSVTDMYEARKSRTVGATKHDRSAREFVASAGGALLGKAAHLSEEVYQAMTARGYRGDAKSAQVFAAGRRDAVFGVVVLAVAVAVVWGDVALGR